MNGIVIFSVVLAACLLGMSIDIYALVRLSSFEQSVHETRHSSGVFWVTPLRKHGELLRLNGKDGSYVLSCNTPGLGGSNSCDFRRRPRSGVYSEVDWISAPGGMFEGTLLFPVAIWQAGEQIYQVPVDQVARVQSRGVMLDIKFLGVVSSVLALVIAFGALRRRARRRG
jgi:hypothetical protein